jgi:SAM-dependent methyltransferase
MAMPDDFDIYADRRLADGYPGLAQAAFARVMQKPAAEAADTAKLRNLMRYLDRIIDLSKCRRVVVVGCGPTPLTMQFLLQEGFDAFGVEPVPDFVTAAREYLKAPDRVKIGAAEHMPFADASQHIVLLRSVMEHVDSPLLSLLEAHRVLAPGGVAFVGTTNRLRFHVFGDTGEYNKRFFNWFPNLVKESYIFKHLHFDPHLANQTERPAVHWYTYDELCRLGRMAGFAQFYSRIDLLRMTDPHIARSPLKRALLRWTRRNAWVRGLVLTQVGGSIFMLKRAEPGAPPTRA